MTSLTVCFSGFSREEAATAQGIFEQANARLGHVWTLAPENDAQHLVIDMDSMYGHMTWLKAHNSGKVTIGLTAGARSETDYLLGRPLDLDALVTVLDQAARQAPASPAPPAPEAPPVTAAAAIEAVTAAARTTGQQAAMPPLPDPVRTTGPRPAMPAREPMLLDFLRPGALAGPVKLQLPGAPLLVIDPTTQTYLGGSGLKVFQPYGETPVHEGDFTPVDAAELAALTVQLGGTQPWARLIWLCALVGGKGVIAPGYDPNARFKLNKWPQTEREYPKHFRVATVMMKGPARLTEIAEQSGSSLADVTDFVNATLVTGYTVPA